MEQNTTEPPLDTTENQAVPPISVHPASPSKKNKKYLLILLLAVAVLTVLGFIGFKLLGSKKPLDKPTAANFQPPATETATNKDVPDAPETQMYENGFLGVKLTYPSNWTAAESENGDGVRLESPAFSYQTVGKGQVAGNFRVYIRKGARDIDGKYIGRGYAFQPSEKLTYNAPAAGQRADTYLSLFGLDAPDNFAFFLIAGNYNLNKGDTLGPNYGKEAETFIIAGGYSAKDLKDDLATNPVPTDTLKSSNAYKQALDILKSLQLR